MKAVIEVLQSHTPPKLSATPSMERSLVASSGNPVHAQLTEPFIDAVEASRFLKLHPKTLLRLARKGSIPAHPLTGCRRHIWRFLLSELDAWARGRLDSGSDRCQNSRS